IGPAFMANGNHRGLVEDDALVTHENQRVGRAQVDGQVGREILAKRSIHAKTLRLTLPDMATRRAIVLHALRGPSQAKPTNKGHATGPASPRSDPEILSKTPDGRR